MEQPSYYAILTADVRYDKQLSAMSKLLFAEITALSQKEDRYTQKDRDPIRKNADIIIQENIKENSSSLNLEEKELKLPDLQEDHRGKHSPAKERLREKIKLLRNS